GRWQRYLVVPRGRPVQVDHLGIVCLPQKPRELAEAELGLVESGPHVQHLPLHVAVPDRLPVAARQPPQRFLEQRVRTLESGDGDGAPFLGRRGFLRLLARYGPQRLLRRRSGSLGCRSLFLGRCLPNLPRTLLASPPPTATPVRLGLRLRNDALHRLLARARLLLLRLRLGRVRHDLVLASLRTTQPQDPLRRRLRDEPRELAVPELLLVEPG